MDQKSQITEILPKSGLVYSEKYVGCLCAAVVDQL